jgi:indole-3-glycerol phosphate synthase
MTDFLDTLAKDAKKTIDSGYYKTELVAKQRKISLKQAILECKGNAVITEIKTASPSLGIIRTEVNPKEVAQTMERAGATGISVLTEPTHFHGSLSTLLQAREAANLPILMKDIVIVADQIDVAAQLGANAVLLLQALFDRHCCELGVEKTIAYAHARGLEVLLETHSETEFKSAVETDADLVGINNRNLATLQIDLEVTRRVLRKHGKCGKVVISESGVRNQRDLQFLRNCGADAFLVGSSIMSSVDIEDKIRKFVQA